MSSRGRARRPSVFGDQDPVLRKYTHRLLRWRPGNRAELLRGGGEAFPAMLAAIAAATKSVHLEIYIFIDDAHGQRFIDALCERARAGVTVRVVFDGLGSWELSAAGKNALHQAGVHLLEQSPIAPWRARFGLLHRNHRKVLIIDDVVAFTGGINLTSQYAAREDGGEGWLDYFVCFGGPTVLDAARLFRANWINQGGDIFPAPPRPETVATSAAAPIRTSAAAEATTNGAKRPLANNPVVRAIRDILTEVRWFGRYEQRTTHDLERSNEAGNEQRMRGSEPTVFARLLHNQGRSRRREFQRAYLTAINNATTYVVIENAYFLPNRQLRHALYRAVARGVQVTALVPANSDVKVVEYAGRYLHRRLLKGGVKVCFWTASMLHAKIAVVDGVWSTVGSYNLDARSLNYNLEVALEVLDPGFGARVKQAADADLAQATPYGEEAWRALPWWRKTLCWLAFLGRRWL